MGLRDRSEAHTQNLRETGLQCRLGALLPKLDADSLEWFEEWAELSRHRATAVTRSKMAADISAELGIRMPVGTLNAHVIQDCCCYGVS